MSGLVYVHRQQWPLGVQRGYVPENQCQSPHLMELSTYDLIRRSKSRISGSFIGVVFYGWDWDPSAYNSSVSVVRKGSQRHDTGLPLE